MKKIAAFIIVSAMLLSLCSCGQDIAYTANNLLIANDSAAHIASIGVHADNQSHGVCNADQSPLKKGVVFGFHIAAQQGCAFRVEVNDEEGNPTALAAFIKDFTDKSDGEIHLYIRDDGRGQTYITDTE